VLALGLLTVPGLPRPLPLVAGLGYAALTAALLLRRAPTSTPLGVVGLSLAVYWVTDGQVVRAFAASAVLFAFLVLAGGVVDGSPVQGRVAAAGLVGAPVTGAAVWALVRHVPVTGLFWWAVGLACLLAAYAIALRPPAAEPHDMPELTGGDGEVPKTRGDQPSTHREGSALWG
jgi:hypothetical protein